MHSEKDGGCVIVFVFCFVLTYHTFDSKNGIYTLNGFYTLGGNVAHILYSRWRHHMEAFSALLAICAGNSPVPGKFPAQRPVTQSFDVFFYLRLNKQLSKQPWGWWFETLSHPLWRHRNVSPGLLLRSSLRSSWYAQIGKHGRSLNATLKWNSFFCEYHTSLVRSVIQK